MRFFAGAVGGLLMHACVSAWAQAVPPSEASGGDDAAGAFWRIYASPLTVHFSNNPEHKNVYSLGLERHHAGGFLVGGAAFRNSFGQPSAYVYAGRRFDAPVASVPQMFFQLSAGVLYGYRAPYEHKVPLNQNGISPGVVGAVGWTITPTVSAQLNVLGDSGVMLQFSFDLH
jgi:hypothetical protein